MAMKANDKSTAMLLDADVIDWHAVAFAEAEGAEASVRDFAPKPLGAFQFLLLAHR